MKKWADYLISEVSYDYDHLISSAMRHQDSEQGISTGKPVDRLTIASDIKNGLIYFTIYSGIESWKKGFKIQTFSLAGNPYLRIDENKVKLDYLGDLPEISIKSVSVQKSPSKEEATPEQLARLEQLEKQLQELESSPTSESPSSPRGLLPKEPSTQLQELESQPEEEEEEEEEEEATPEQLARLEQLEKQLQELESSPTSESPSSPRGLLPKEPSTQLQELESQPEEEEEEEEATPHQLDDLQKQLDDLKTILFAPISPKSNLQEEATPHQLDDLQKQLDDLETILSTNSNSLLNQSTNKQFLTIKRLEKEIKDLTDTSKEHKIIQTLHKQNKKLNSIEKQLQNSITNKNNSSENLLSEIFCVKCKTKRKIIHPEKTILKNGRTAIKGICTVCNSKVFRFIKMNKK